NVVMAFVIIQALKVTGLLDIVGRVCEPIMALWGLPGAAATVLLASVMSMGGGVGVCASLVVAGTLSGHDATILLPAIYLMGNPVQNTGRCLGTAGVNPKYYPHIIAVCVINALLSMWVMQLLF
ncbi:YjiG family protein, partial [Enterobacter hormaechei]